MKAQREILIFIKIIPLLFLSVSHLCARDKTTDLTELLEKSRNFKELMLPDSIRSISELALLKGFDRNRSEYLEIIRNGIAVAIDLQRRDMVIRFTEDIIQSDSMKENPGYRGNLYLMMAGNYLNMHEYNQSMHYCTLAYNSFGETNQLKGICQVLLKMYDNAYFSQEDSTNINYLDLAVETAKKDGDSTLLGDVYFTVGKSCYRSGKFEEAIANYELARKYTTDRKLNQYLVICIYQHLVYALCDSVERACELSTYILDQCLANEFRHFLSNAYLGQAFCSARRGYADSTKMFLDLSEEWRSKTPKVNASPGYYDQMYKVSMIISDYDRALRYLEIKAEQENLINRKNNASVLGDSRAEFDYLLQKARISELKAQNETAQEKAKRRKTTILGITAILLISMASFLNMRKQYVSLGLSYKSLVKKHLEVDSLNSQLLKDRDARQNRRSGFHIKDEDVILVQLKKLLGDDKIWTKTDLSLNFLADKLGTNTSYLSTIINTHYLANFKSLINKYRIDEARRLLISKKGAGYTIEGIAQEVGFQSRSVFYQTFRQVTGLTPTAYVKIYKSVCPDS